jgi:hypothetical protein
MSHFQLRASGSRFLARWRRTLSEKTLPFRRACVQSWVLPEILRWKEPADFPLESSVEVHLLTSKRDWLCAAWTLASLVHFSGRRWPMVVHDDGTLPQKARQTFTRMFGNLRIVSRPDADREVEAQLTDHPRCLAYRRSHPLALKLFDCPLLAQAPRILLLDSDVLFFRRPEEVLAWVDRGEAESFFNPDFQDAYTISREDAQARWGIDLWPMVNTGLSLLPRAILDLGLCEKWLGDAAIIAPEHIAWREQTLLALSASRLGRGGLLPESYEVSFNPEMANNAVTRHYVGDMRSQFYAEGVLRVRRALKP